MDYRIVVVDDEPFSLTNAKNLLRARKMRVDCLRSGRDLLAYVEKHTPDLILLDILMPEMDGFETYRALRQYEDRAGKPQIPVIFLTGEDSNETERRGLKAGASDYIHKPLDEDILISRISNTIENTRTIESLTEEATQDRLTGFLNKTSGTDKVSGLCRKSDGTLLIMDLDSFKLVNDLYGHDMGDRILVAFAGIVRLNVREDDVICRIGGDEFMGFFPNMTEEGAVASLADRLNEQLSKEAARLMGENHGIPLGISIGAASVSADVNDFKILFQYADSALYEVKRNGKHGYRIYDPEEEFADTEEDLDRDLENVVRIVTERGDGRGALLLGQEAFSWNYRFIERYLMRYGGEAVRMLISLSSEEKGVLFSEIVSEFGKVLKNVLRRTDIILQWQQNRYFVVLSQLTEKDVPRTIERITEAWKAAGYTDRIRIQYAISILKKDHYKSTQ